MASHEACQVANQFIRRAKKRNKPLSHLHVQKLIYFAHARMLALHKRPLIVQDIEAWAYGPVVRDVYSSLKHNGASPIEDEIPMNTEADFPMRESDIIDWCLNSYGDMSGPNLIALTHIPKTPWDKACKALQPIIPNDSMEEYYAEEWRQENLADAERLSKHPSVAKETLASIANEDGNSSEGYTPEQLKGMIKRAGCS